MLTLSDIYIHEKRERAIREKGESLKTMILDKRKDNEKE